jgi:phage tail sheath gpL-like
MVIVPGVPNSYKTPGDYVFVNLGGPGSAAGAAIIKALIVGNMIATAITGAAPSFTTGAGTYLAAGGGANETPVDIQDSDDAKAKFGQGSELHLMAKAYYAQDPSGAVTALPVAVAGSAASATLTLVGTATGNGTIRTTIHGVAIDVAVATGDTPTVMATNIATAIVIGNPDLQVTAQFLLGVMTVTAKHTGLRGNAITFRADWIDGINVIAIGTSTSKFGVAATITGSGKLAGGATQDNASNAILAIANQKYDRIALAFTDATNINRFRDDLDSKAAALVKQWGQAIAATVGTLAAAQTLTGDPSTGINANRVQVAWLKNSDSLSCEIAAQVMAARINGDSSVGSNTKGENVFMGSNLNGCLLKTILVQPTKADRPTAANIETALNYGITPLEPSPEHPGFVKMTASITTKHYDSVGAFTYAVYKTKTVSVADYIADDLCTDFRTTYKGFNLADDPADGSPIKIDGQVTPKTVKDRVVMKLRDYERRGLITAVTELLPLVQANINVTNRARLDMNIPAFPTPDLDIIAAQLLQVSL